MPGPQRSRARFEDTGPPVEILDGPAWFLEALGDKAPKKPKSLTYAHQLLAKHLPGQHSQATHGGGGGRWPDDVAADRFGNEREGGQWFDADGIYMTDGYVDQYGLPVTHSGFGAPDSSRDRNSIVLEQGGEMHIMRERDGGPSDAIYSRDSKDVLVEGVNAEGARSLRGDLLDMADASTLDRPTDEDGDDIGGEDFGVGATRTNQATGVKLTSAPRGSVIVAGLGKGGSDATFTEGEVADFADALDTMADAADEWGAGLG